MLLAAKAPLASKGCLEVQVLEGLQAPWVHLGQQVHQELKVPLEILDRRVPRDWGAPPGKLVPRGLPGCRGH